MTNSVKQSLIAALSFLFVMAFSPMTMATENPFGMSNIDTNQMNVAEKGKCGEGKCGAGKKKAKCGGEKKEGKCGDSMKKDGKCGSSMKKDGKCGEGKCGGKK